MQRHNGSAVPLCATWFGVGVSVCQALLSQPELWDGVTKGLLLPLHLVRRRQRAAAANFPGFQVPLCQIARLSSPRPASLRLAAQQFRRSGEIQDRQIALARCVRLQGAGAEGGQPCAANSAGVHVGLPSAFAAAESKEPHLSMMELVQMGLAPKRMDVHPA